jgi:hypothetical protein
VVNKSNYQSEPASLVTDTRDNFLFVPNAASISLVSLCPENWLYLICVSAVLFDAVQTSSRKICVATILLIRQYLGSYPTVHSQKHCSVPIPLYSVIKQAITNSYNSVNSTVNMVRLTNCKVEVKSPITAVARSKA